MKRRVSDNNFDIVLLISRYVIYCWLKIKHMSKIQYKISLLPTTIKMFFFFFFLGGGGGTQRKSIFTPFCSSVITHVRQWYVHLLQNSSEKLPALFEPAVHYVKANFVLCHSP